MAKLVILGSSNALSSKDSENTHMVLVGQERIVMIDCINNQFIACSRRVLTLWM
jgi:hypothetical protein